MTKTVAVLLTVFNRKAKTLKCLESFFEQLPVEGYCFDVYLTNDGCTDGTPETVVTQFPQVNIVEGDGTLFWNRGMYRAWEAAANVGYDLYLWLNDDVTLLEGAVETLLAECAEKGHNAIIVGSMRASQEPKLTYGGHGNNGKITPNGQLQQCDTFNGNVILIPHEIYAKVGNLDWRFRHAIGDLDYGCRARRAGFEMYVSSRYLGICDSNIKRLPWVRKDVPFIKRVKNLYSPLGYAEPFPFFIYELKNFGLLIAIKHFISIHIRLIFPALWR
ncbi:MAG: glycosyltransferase family 2 protein [Rikenellaceae bacterium]